MTLFTFQKKILGSTSIDHVYYDFPEQNLFVRFHNGTVAGYKGIAPLLADEFLESDSLGSFYNSRIRGKFPGVSASGEFVSRYTKQENPVLTPKPTLTLVKETSKKRTFKVRGYVLVEEEYLADSVEEAVAAFRDANQEDAVVKEVVVNFE